GFISRSYRQYLEHTDASGDATVSSRTCRSNGPARGSEAWSELLGCFAPLIGARAQSSCQAARPESKHWLPDREIVKATNWYRTLLLEHVWLKAGRGIF